VRVAALDTRHPRNYVAAKEVFTMATRAQRKLAMRLKKARRERAQAEKRAKRAEANFKKVLRKYRAA
jgi:hypothetical protein